MEKTTTVFIADSAEDFTSGLSAALQRADGFHVLGTAGDGELAIRMIEEKKPDILILDLMLPKKDGIAVLKAILPWSASPSCWPPPHSSRSTSQMPPQTWASAI